MCDDVGRILVIVKKVKEVEKRTGREVFRIELNNIYAASRDQKSFEVDGVVFSPPAGEPVPNP